MTTLSSQIERLAMLVAAQTGKSPEEVIREAVEAQARLAGVKIPEAVHPRKKIDLVRVREITHRVASRPLLDTRSPQEILDDAWSQRG